jgi:hypothetical protein
MERRDHGIDAAWVLVAIGLVAVLALIIVIVADQNTAAHRLPTSNSLAQPPPMDLPMPVPVPVLPSAGPSTTTSSAAPRTRRPPAIGPVRTRRPPTTRPTGTTEPKVGTPGLTPGRLVSLQPAGQTGFRVRHRDFRARVERVDAASPATDRADATFVVRAGLSDARCVSLESVNYPGWYLRHRHFRLLLQARDGGAPFAADATFCPATVAPSRATVLRSVDDPHRYLVQRGSRLFLDRVPAGGAMPLVVRPPL